MPLLTVALVGVLFFCYELNYSNNQDIRKRAVAKTLRLSVSLEFI